jgi:hypothetical protein
MFFTLRSYLGKVILHMYTNAWHEHEHDHEHEQQVHM